MEEAKRISVDSSDEGDLEGQPQRQRPRTKYVCKFICMGQRVKIDRCLAARLVLASVLLTFISFTVWAMFSLDRKLNQ